MSDITQPVQQLFGGLQSNYTAYGAPIQSPVSQEQIDRSYGQSQDAYNLQRQLAEQLGGAGGIQNQQNVFGQQQALANALQQQASGQGPNPALAQLNQQTGNNISAQAALMAGQRGTNANPGLIARQIAQQGAGIQQNAVGQAAVMQAQQQLAAQQQLMAQQSAMQQVAGNQIGNALAGQNAYSGLATAQQGNILGAQGQFNNANVSNTANANQSNQQTSSQNAQIQGQLIGGALNGAASAGAKAAFMSKGGAIHPEMAHMMQIYHPNMAQGGKVPVMLSPGEAYVDPSSAQKVASGQESLSQTAKKIPGKAKVKGDSEKNDTVPAKLEEGGIVIPRSVMESEDPVKEGTKFLVDALKKHGKGKEENDFKSALKKAVAARGDKK